MVKHFFITTAMGKISDLNKTMKHELQERKRIESERRFRDLAELLPETIFKVDTTGRLTFFNKRAFNLFGYTIDDFDLKKKYDFKNIKIIKEYDHDLEPFFITKSVDKGTDIGLLISYFIIVDDHKGKIEVESESEKGTKFIVRLPLHGL